MSKNARRIRKRCELNENKNTIPSFVGCHHVRENLQHYSYNEKEEQSQINDFSFYLKKYKKRAISILVSIVAAPSYIL